MATVEPFESEERAAGTLGIQRGHISLIAHRTAEIDPRWKGHPSVRVWAQSKKRGGKWHFWTAGEGRPAAQGVGIFVFKAGQ